MSGAGPSTSTAGDDMRENLEAEEQQEASVRPEEQVAECEEALKDHAALCRATDEALRDLLAADKFLDDIPYDISPEEIQDQIAVLKGQSIKLYVKRELFSTLRVIVPQSTATVLDLKRAVRRTFDLDQKRRRRKSEQRSSAKRHSQSDYELGTNISWKYIWRTYLLALDNSGRPGEPLLDDRQLLSNYGVVNKSVLRFVKRVKIERQKRLR